MCKIITIKKININKGFITLIKYDIIYKADLKRNNIIT